ncbi:MAG: cell envelope integrity protein TolA [Proteobacteria bacterium]|nr:MAG: cell envelope integrity protein TolA [Pseudomonadota bacterium]
MRRLRARKTPGRFRALILAIAVHLVVVAIAVVAFRWPSEPSPGADIVKAVVVDDTEELKKQEAKRKKAAAKKKAEAKRKKAAAKRKKEEQKRKAKTERKRKEAEKKRLAEQNAKEEAARKRKEEQQRTAEERRLEEERRLLEEERRREEEEERQRIEAERQLAESLEAEERERRAAAEAEERERKEAARKARALTAAEKYKLLIRQKVSRNWARPPGAQRGLQCTVRVRLVPSGDVLQVTVAKTSGDEQFDRSVENAVYKASPLPLPGDRDLFEYFREIEFIFNPED